MRTRVVLISLICNLAVSAAFAQSTVTATDLQHHRWVLETINDDPLPAIENKGKIPELDFGEQMQVTGNTGCNQFNGKAVLRDGFFLIEAMASTRMMCPAPWDDIEITVQTALGHESTISLDAEKKLTLQTADTTLIFRLEDWVAAAQATVSSPLIGIPASSQESSASGSAESEDVEMVDIPHHIGYRNRSLGFGGPNTPQQQLDDDDVIREPIYRFGRVDEFFKPWFDTKKRFNEERDFQYSFDYNVLSQGISDSIGTEDNATGGVLRAYGTWVLTRQDDKDFGRLIYNVNHRHKVFSDIAPADLAGQAGYIGVTGTLFSDVNLVLIDLNWQQSFNDANTGLIAGRFDPNDYMGVLGYANPWTAFSNAAIVLNPSVAFPDGSLGIGGGHRFNDQWYVKGSINDANGVITDLKAFKGGAEFFKWAEIGWTPAPDQHYLTNIHAVAWHVDERENAGIPSAHGFMLGASKTTDDQRWMGFVRAGWSKGSAPIYNETYSLGLVRRVRRNSDEIGLAINWGDPPDSSLSSQTTGEFFYRLQLSQGLAITPSIQLLKDPALNDQHSQVWVYGIRMRLTL